MISNKKVIAWIPARGGSKGIKHKNIVLLGGKPLIAYTIEAAKNSKYIDEIMVSTDSEEIANVAREYGACVKGLRPPHLASDTARTIDAVMHDIGLLEGDGYSIFCLLQPTSPLRSASDIDGALELFIKKGCCSVVGVSPVEDSPLLIRSIDTEGCMHKLLEENSTCRRQDMPEYYRVNGSIYVNSLEEITAKTSFNDNAVPYIMEKNHGIDIDTPMDLHQAEYLLGF